jgi:hypothetical protein
MNPFEEAQPESPKGKTRKETSGVRTRKRSPSFPEHVHEALGELIPEEAGLEALARGGEHTVFEFTDPENEKMVFKVNSLQLEETARAYLMQHGEYSYGEEKRIEAQERLKHLMKERQTKIRLLRKYFGRNVVPAEKVQITDVPISREVINAMSPYLKLPDYLDLPKSIPALTVLQRRLELDPERTLSLNAGAAEDPSSLHTKEGESPEVVPYIYDLGHRVLTEQKVEGLDDEEALHAALNMYEGLFRVQYVAEHYEGFKGKLQESVRTMIRFTQETGMALDVIGGNNVVMLQTDSGWELRMPDPFFGGDLTLDELEIAAAKIRNDLPLTPTQHHQALVVLNSVRIVNAMAMIAGIPDRIKLPYGVTQIDSETWRETLSSYYQTHQAAEAA